MSERTCERCAVPLQLPKGGWANRKRYCSGNCVKRASDERHRAACIDCGVALGSGSAWRGVKRCRTCHAATVAASMAERDGEFERLWAEGKTWHEIAAHFNWLYLGRFAVELDSARRRGAKLPYRRKHHKHKPRYPDQVAA